jgi:hypothetical protein
MLQGHVFHSFTRVAEREHGFYIYSQFLGGQAAAVFLFLTGITYGMGIERRSQLGTWARVFAALKRARYLFLLAILFRLQLFITGWGHTRWQDLFQVDVLNLMGATAVLLSLVALANEPLRRLRWALLAGTVFAALAPVMSSIDALALPWFLSGYIVPGASFSIFPWGSFMAFGLACGSMIPLLRGGPRENWNRVLQWAALCGFALIMLGLYCSQLPFSIYENAQFWVDSPALIACKLGATLLMAAAAFLWTDYLHPSPSFLRLLGMNSLAVYWIHIELVYGNALWFFKESLAPWQSAVAAVAMIALMTAMCWAISRYAIWQRVGAARNRAASMMFGLFGGRHRASAVLTGLGLTGLAIFTFVAGR